MEENRTERAETVDVAVTIFFSIDLTQRRLKFCFSG